MSNLVHEIHDNFCLGMKIVLGVLLIFLLAFLLIAGIFISLGLAFNTEQALLVMSHTHWIVYGASIICWITFFGFILKNGWE